MTIKEKVFRSLEVKGEMAVVELTDELEVTKQSIHLALNQLISEGKVVRLGRAPKTIYKIKGVSKIQAETPILDQSKVKFLRDHFLLITEIGEFLEGLAGFEVWCHQRKLPVLKTLDEYILTSTKYASYFNTSGLIDGNEKFRNTKEFEKLFLDEIFYLDFYAIERFGKTRLGTLLHYAKQGQNKFLMKKMLDEIKPKIASFLEESPFDAVGFVPPTIRREVQIMKFMERQLNIHLPKLTIQKVSGIIPVPQKSLNKIEQRIVNAENTFAVVGSMRFNSVLLIDDAVGSGSTLNQIAGKLKQKGIAKKVTGWAVVGSFKGFDVITDV